MSRSSKDAIARRLTQPWLGPTLALTLAVGVGLLLAELLMTPPASDLRDLAAYLTLSGVATLGAGWLALRLADRVVGLTIQTKAFLSVVIGNGVALLNVFIVAQLMFISTSHDLKLLVALLVFSAVVTIFFSLWVASAVVARIGAVATGIHSLAAGNYRARVDVSGGDEVAALATDLNRLAARIQAAEEQQQALEQERRDLTAAISHDLRTPLASVRAMVEALDDSLVEDRVEVRRYYGVIRREIERLSRMIDGLFELAQMDAGALQLDRHTIALQEIAAEVVAAMEADARRKDVTLCLRLEGEPPDVSVDGARLERAVDNLVRNALEHTPAGGRVEVSVAGDDGWVALRVSDTGDGIDEADLSHVWDRFYRAEKSRKRDPASTDGAGLGLAIVRGIVEAHGGAVDVDSGPRRGSVFTLRLPRLPRP